MRNLKIEKKNPAMRAKTKYQKNIYSRENWTTKKKHLNDILCLVINNKICCYYYVICNLFCFLYFCVWFQSKISSKFSCEKSQKNDISRKIFLMFSTFVFAYLLLHTKDLVWCLLLTSWTTTIASTFRLFSTFFLLFFSTSCFSLDRTWFAILKMKKEIRKMEKSSPKSIHLIRNVFSIFIFFSKCYLFSKWT